MNKLLEKQIAKIKENYPEEEFLPRLYELIGESYEELEKAKKLKDRSIRLMSKELLDLYRASQKKNEALISTILENIVDGIIICDPWGKIVSINSSAQDILQISEDELIGEEMVSLLEEFTYYEEFLFKYNRHSEQTEKHMEVLLKGRERSNIPCELSASKFEVDEIGLIVIFRDITDRKKHQEQIIEEKEKAEKASLAKAEFLSTMSHEIRTPMNSIIGMTNILQQDEENEERKKLLDTLKFSSEHLLVLINDILDFNKIEAGKIEFEKVDFNLKDLITNIVESNKIKAQEKNIGLNINWDKELEEYVIGDPSRLAQILTNLIGNAIKFTDDGQVEVMARLKKSTKEFQTIYFEVNDTGIGISKDKLNLIFESFSQSETYTTRKYGGTGLGLAITKRLIELQDGTIKVTSKPNEGSQFFFELKYPRSEFKPTEVQNATQHKKKEDLVGLKILLVEDHPMNQFVASKFLNKWKCNVDIVDDGNKALKKIDQSEYNIVLMDLQMPNKNGFETTKEIRASKKAYSDIPIIALTASAFLEERQRALAAGMDDFITKPFNPEDLYEKISKNAVVTR